MNLNKIVDKLIFLWYNENKNVKTGENVMKIGFFGLLTIVFIILKLTGAIGWSWFWVLSPLFVVPVIFVVAFIVGFFVFLHEKTKG